MPRLPSPLLALLLLACGSHSTAPPSDPALDLAAQESADEAPNPAPGAEPFSAQTGTRIQQAWAQRPEGTLPRTRHLAPDGAPLFINRLVLQSSPYLRQHAHNPVDWYPWGDEAFDAAARLGRPVLLSIGYATCHWCHVMEEESFEDLEIARYMNEHYVAIKVDREERPDVDAVYMAAVQAINGRGGWPMTLWLTADRRPFFAATYLPARDGDRGRGQGFLTVLAQMHDLASTQPERVAAAADQLDGRLASSLAPSLRPSAPEAETLVTNAERAIASFDPIYGGRAGAPKFPSSLPMRFLLQEHLRTGDPRLLGMVTLTLGQLAASGIHDAVGGGFHRYATDAQWQVPHFEKMLYDNALLAMIYGRAWQITGSPEHERLLREILQDVAANLTSPQGGFYSATDADSPLPGTSRREEGWFFTWTPDELAAALDPAELRVALAWWEIRPEGNFEGRNILHSPHSVADVCAELGMTPEAFEQQRDAIRRSLDKARRQRPPPLRDDKIIAAWNGLMISAYARAALLFGDAGYLLAAVRAADFVLGQMRTDGRLHRIAGDAQSRPVAVIEDYAFVIAGLIDLFEATGEARWLQEALALDAVVLQHYEGAQGGWFRTADDGERLLARERPDYDGAEPTGASVQVLNLYRLAAFTSQDGFRQRADRALNIYGERLQQGALAEMLLALDWHLDRPKEIVIVTPGGRAQAEPLLRVLRREGPRNHILVVSPAAGIPALSAVVPQVEGKIARDGQATAYVCEQGACQFPTTDPTAFQAQLR